MTADATYSIGEAADAHADAGIGKAADAHAHADAHDAHAVGSCSLYSSATCLGQLP